MATIVIVTFALTLTIVLGMYWLGVDRPELAHERAMQKRLMPSGAPLMQQTLMTVPTSLSAMNWFDTLLTRAGRLLDPLRHLVEQSGNKLTVGAVLLMCAFLGLTLGLAADYFITVPGVPLLVAAAGVAAPILVLRQLVQRRLQLFEAQFPNAIDLMARSLRAGHALATALELVGKEMSDPTGAEFRLLFERQNYGMSLEDALRAFAKRVPLLDARFFATAVLTQREVGGNLAEVLENLSAVMRERFKVRREIRIASAHGRITGWILGLLAPFIAVVLSVISPALMQELFRDPLGVRMLIGALALDVIGILIIRRIVNVEY